YYAVVGLGPVSRQRPLMGDECRASRYSGATSPLTNNDTGINTRPNGADKSMTPGSSTDQSAKLASIIVSTIPDAPPRSKRTLSPTFTSTPLGYFISHVSRVNCCPRMREKTLWGQGSLLATRKWIR